MIYDSIIIGAGPAGLTAGIYLARANKKVLIFERMAYGGQIAEIGEIENYPGVGKVSGMELASVMFEQAKSLGAEFKSDEVLSYNFSGEIKKVKTSKGTYECKTLILALGSMSRKLGIPNEKKFIGSGLSYCATCDGNFFKNKDVAIIGTGDSAISNAKYLENIVKKIYIISKYEQMHLKSYLPNVIDELKNSEIIYSAKVIDLLGNDFVEGIKVEHDGKIEDIKVDGVFVSIGRMPNTENLIGKIDLDERGYIKVDDNMQTNIPGVFGAGDVTINPVKQIVTAASSGAIAATNAIKFLNK